MFSRNIVQFFSQGAQGFKGLPLSSHLTWGYYFSVEVIRRLKMVLTKGFKVIDRLGRARTLVLSRRLW